jgi:Holliday junction resolvase RusA-like endonuclease
MYITIHGRIPSKKNGKSAFVIRNRAIITDNPDYKRWHKGAMEQVALQVLQEKGAIPYSKTSNVIFTLFAPDARKGDLSNKWESVADLLVDSGVFEDDNWTVIGRVILQYGGIDRTNPRAEVLID